MRDMYKNSIESQVANQKLDGILTAKELPKRTADTMSLAIGLSSPNGLMSKRGKANALEKLSTELFGEEGLQLSAVKQPSEKDRLLMQAKNLRELAALGMKSKSYNKKADELERLANEK